MIFTLALLAISFAPTTDSVPNRQPQLASVGKRVALVYGAGDDVYFAFSQDSGSRWSKPVVIANNGKLALGARRGPRVAITRDSIVVTAIVGEIGRGRDENLLSWRSEDQGKTWSQTQVLNDMPAAAREGLHTMASDGKDTVFVAWLDLRTKGTQIYGVVSRDSGRTWSKNRLIYRSPSGRVCECCHPSAVIDSDGKIWVMFRNSVDGNRDMYVVVSQDQGEHFSAAQKLGSGHWKLEACPMDGGSIAVTKGRVAAVWRREDTVYRSGTGGAEVALGKGRQPVAVSTARGPVYAWTNDKFVFWLRGDEQKPREFYRQGSFLSLVSLANGRVLVAGERDGAVFVDPLED